MQARITIACSGHERVKAMLGLYAEWSLDVQGRRGCLVVGSAFELSSSDPEVAGRVAKVFKRHETRLKAFVQLGIEDGSIPAHVDGAATARLLLCLMQGMRVLGKTGQTRKSMDSLVGAAMKILA